jgi:predicted Fe-S protein YdhL (DUF1289 family)
VSTLASIVTPCVLVCFIDPESGLCLGCFRTGDEIASWIAMTPEGRAQVMTELPSRRMRISPDKLG